MAGLSGISLYVPSSRVRLDDWSKWNQQNPAKLRAVVGDAFRVAGKGEDVYTMASQAVLRLVEQYDVDPSSVGLLILATESSTDNAVGGPTVKGLVDKRLAELGLPQLSRNLETFEMKQACLSGINALLAATRFVESEPRSKAIVVAGDIAEYERGSSGEPTQGAGAVAMLVESKARLITIDPRSVGRSAADRVYDFRKPVRGSSNPDVASRPLDFPAFAGHYSTYCYSESVDEAFLNLSDRLNLSPRRVLEGSTMILSHRPYEKMPQASLARLYLRGQLGAAEPWLQSLVLEHGLSFETIEQQIDERVELSELCREPNAEPTPELHSLVKLIAKTPAFREFLRAKTGFGAAIVRELGNLYAASLPAWIGAALELAAEEDLQLEGPILLLGYGSGDAALAIHAELVDGWQRSAKQCGFRRAMKLSVDLSQGEYEQAHDREAEPLSLHSGPVITTIGQGPDDRGIPYYGLSQSNA